MTNDEIKELAWTAGATIRHTAGLFQLSDYRATHFGFSLEALTKFAELIQARAVPDGYVVVPATAHDEQWEAAFDIYDKQFHQDQMQSQIMCIKEMYRAMIEKGSV